MTQTQNINCKSEGVKCSHTWTIPNFEQWIGKNEEQWLEGKLFSPISQCLLQLQILATTPTNVKVFLKNVGVKSVKIESHSLKLCKLANPSFGAFGQPRLRFSSASTRVQQTRLVMVSQVQQNLALQPKCLSNEVQFNWKTPGDGWTSTLGDPIPKQSFIIECNLTIIITNDNYEAVLDLKQKSDCSSLVNDMDKLMINPSFSDWTLNCGGEEIECHRSILGARSPVFETMFEQTGFQESSTHQTQITDIEFSTLKALLKYIYTDIIDPENEHTEELFVAADKYDIQGLRNRCELILAERINEENCAELFLLSYLHGGKQLKEKCMEMIAKNYKSVKLTEKWIEIQSNPSLSSALVQIIDYMSDLI